MKRGKEKEIRCFSSQFETREDDSGNLYIDGYFSVFDSIYEICPGATESIAPTAFDDTLSKDIRALINHESRLVLGRTKAGTLTLKVDSRGLWGEIKINPKDQDAMNLYERVKRRDVDQCSFGFNILDEEYETNGEKVHWTIKKVELYEVSVVTFPAYENTSVTARDKQLADIKNKSAESFKIRMMSNLKD